MQGLVGGREDAWAARHDAPGRPAPAGGETCRQLLDAVREMGIATKALRYGAGEVVYDAGEPDDGLYVLTSGAIKIHPSRSADRKRAVLRLIGPWETFGRLWVACEPGDGGTVAEALVGCTVEKVPRIFVRRAALSRPDAALVLVTLLEERLAAEEEFARCLLPRGTRQRLARLLPLLDGKFGADAPDGAGREVRLPLTRSRLAEMISSTRESVTKAMIELRDEGLVRMEHGRVSLPDPEALAQIGGR